MIEKREKGGRSLPPPFPNRTALSSTPAKACPQLVRFPFRPNRVRLRRRSVVRQVRSRVQAIPAPELPPRGLRTSVRREIKAFGPSPHPSCHPRPNRIRVRPRHSHPTRTAPYLDRAATASILSFLDRAAPYPHGRRPFGPQAKLRPTSHPTRITLPPTWPGAPRVQLPNAMIDPCTAPRSCSPTRSTQDNLVIDCVLHTAFDPPPPPRPRTTSMSARSATTTRKRFGAWGRARIGHTPFGAFM